MADIRTEIDAIVAEAADKIAALFREEAVKLASAFGGTATAATTRGKKTASVSSSAPKRGKGEKRTQAQIEATRKQVADHIKRNPGQRIEEINRALGTTTKDLALPLKKLIAEKSITTKGQKRSTKYYPKK